MGAQDGADEGTRAPMLPPHPVGGAAGSPLIAKLQSLGVPAPVCNRVMLVDDEPDNLFVLEALLEDECEVVLAGSGLEALELMAAQEPFDLIVSDQRMPGMSGVELLGEVAERHPETVRMVLTAYADVGPIVEAVNVGAVYRFLLKPWDPTEMRAAVSDSLARKAHGEALRLVVAAQTDRHSRLVQTLGDLERAQAQLVAADRLTTLGRLTSGVTHEIRNQLAVTQVLMETIEEETTNPEVVAPARDALAALKSMLQLMRHVTAFSKRQRLDVACAEVATARFLSETLALFRLEEVGRGRDVRVILDPGAGSLFVDARGLGQALLALLRNAAIASAPDQSIDVRASVGAHEGVVITVSDHGAGMDADFLAKAVEPFFTGTEPPGLGLGLEIARVVTEGHGGKLELESVPGQGTLARMILAEGGRS